MPTSVPLVMNRLAAVWRRLWTFRSVGRSFARFRFRSLYDYFIAGCFDCVAANVDAAFGIVDVLPFERAALAAPHSGRDDELEVGFVQDAHGFQVSVKPNRAWTGMRQ